VRWIKVLFVVSGIYDGVLALAFLFFGSEIYETFSVTPPGHWGYIQLLALLLLIFAIMFLRIAADPIARREQILYGMGLKVSYIGVVFWYLVQGGVPALWIPWAWADVAFFILFIWAWKSLAAKI
jgi:hypothetical protein